MLVLKPVILCIITLLAVMMLKNFSNEFVPFVILTSGALLLIYSLPYIESVLNTIYTLESKFSGLSSLIKVCIKIISIALICEFTSQLCSDNGHGYIAAKINFIGKIIILATIAPLIIEFIEYILELMVQI